MSGLLILLGALVIPYVALNVHRVLSGRRWAFTFCQAAKEWDERERAKELAARANGQVAQADRVQRSPTTTTHR